jgi:hypothetical protein
MRCARVLFSYTVSEDVFRLTGFESAGVDRFAISLFASKPDGFERVRKISRSRWSADVGIASAISKPGACCQVSYAGQLGHAQTPLAKNDGRYLSPLASTAQAMRAGLLARATTATLRWTRDTSCSSH